MNDVTIGRVRLYCGDCREIMPSLDTVDAVIADPPYGDTSLAWDKKVDGWLPLVRETLLPHGSLWCFGSMRFFLESQTHFAGWRYAQDLVWEKHNGSGFAADRFKRVHEHIVQYYPVGRTWKEVYTSPVTTPDATARTVRRKTRPTHTGHIEASSYTSDDGGPRLMRSVIYARSCHGYAIHPTQKPTEILDPLVRYSVPLGGTVGDWFMGSGSLAIVALRLGRGYIGCESDPVMFEQACERVDREFRNPYAEQLGLFAS